MPSEFRECTIELFSKCLEVILAGSAVVPSISPTSAMALLSGYIGLKLFDATSKGKAKGKQEKLLLNLNSVFKGTEATLEKFLDDHFVESFDSSMDRAEILKRLKVINSIVANSELDLKAIRNKLSQDKSSFVSMEHFFYTGFEQIKYQVEKIDQSLARRFQKFFAQRPKLYCEEYKYNPKTPEIGWYIYQCRRTRFVGRKEEKQKILSFLNSEIQDENKLLWWALTGEGGSGKSRLAFEICREMRNQWYAGFLDRSQKLEEWNDFKPIMPTLVVVDYASDRADELGWHIKSLFDHRHEFDHPIRFLLLARASNDKWLDRLKGVSSQCLAIESCRYSPSHLELSNLRKGDLWKLVCDIFRQRGKCLPSKKETVQLINKIDEHGRPLFASIVADAIADGESIQWNKTMLVEYVIKRELDRWKRSGIDEKHLNLLTFSTMVCGITVLDKKNIDRYTNAFQDKTLSDMLPSFDAVNLEWFSFLCGHQIIEEKIPSLEPDILGECFVLHRFMSENPIEIKRNKNRLEALISVAWRLYPSSIGMLPEI